MKSINLNAYAKLNLSLNVLPKIKNGYHEVKFLNCEIGLNDEIKIKRTEGQEIILRCDWQNLECYDSSCPGDCLAYRAAEILKNKFPKKIGGVEISIDKKIPVRAGLGGGSADGAAVLKGINKLYNLKLSEKRLIKFAKKLGNDVCYNVVGGLCKVEGMGEKITPLEYKFSKYYLVIVVPKIKKPSTAWAYKNLDKKKIGKNLEKFEKLLLSLKPKTYNLKPINYLHNDFEFSIFKIFSEVKKIKDDFLLRGAENVILAGSGLSVVGFFREKERAKKVINIFNNNYQTFFSRIL